MRTLWQVIPDDFVIYISRWDDDAAEVAKSGWTVESDQRAGESETWCVSYDDGSETFFAWTDDIQFLEISRTWNKATRIRPFSPDEINLLLKSIPPDVLVTITCTTSTSAYARHWQCRPRQW